MKEFCRKEIDFQVIKLNNNCKMMIEVMKQYHQELEITDMVVKPTDRNGTVVVSDSSGDEEDGCTETAMRSMSRDAAVISREAAVPLMATQPEEITRELYRAEFIKGAVGTVSRRQEAIRQERMYE